MKIRSIGVDGDGILTNLDLFQYALGLEKLYGIKLLDGVYSLKFNRLEELIYYFEEEYYRIYGVKPNMKEIIKDPKSYNLRDIFGISKLKEYKIGTIPFLKYCRSYQFRKNASRVMNFWHDDGRKIHLITARKYIDDKSPEMIRDFVRRGFDNLLFEADIPYDSIRYCPEKGSPQAKLAACEELGVQLINEDKVDNIELLRRHLFVVSFLATYNQDCVGDNLFTVDNDFVGADEVIRMIESDAHPVILKKTLT